MSDKHDRVTAEIINIQPVFRTIGANQCPPSETIAALLRKEYGAAGPLRIFQCEQCGTIFDPATPEARQGWHIVVNTVSDGDGYPTPEQGQCGPVNERFIADETHSYNRGIDECIRVLKDAATRFEQDNERLLSKQVPVAGQIISILLGTTDMVRHLRREE